MPRARSEYRLSPLPLVEPRPSYPFDPPTDSQRDALAAVLLAGYRGTVDDEGETIEEARVAIDHYLSVIDRSHSIVLLDADAIVAMSFVVRVGGIPYIDPVVVAPDRKRQGLGTEAVGLSLASLRRGGASEVGAAITDGNTASEQLFTRLGFTRRGPWPPLDPTSP